MIDVLSYKDAWAKAFSTEILITAIRLAALVLIGLPAIYMASKWLSKRVAARSSAHQGMLVGKIVYYAGFLAIVVTVLGELNFHLGAALGAAGILGVAVGFASQTSLSNIISGLFLIAEKPFAVGDVITIGEITGQVLSIDILSVKLRTFDNRFVRIPNETIIKGQVTNVSRFPIRRMDVKLTVAYSEEVGRVREILLDIGRRNPLCLQEPEPSVIFSGFGVGSVELLFAVWTAKGDWLNLQNSIHEEIRSRFLSEGVAIPAMPAATAK